LIPKRNQKEIKKKSKRNQKEIKNENEKDAGKTWFDWVINFFFLT